LAAVVALLEWKYAGYRLSFSASLRIFTFGFAALSIVWVTRSVQDSSAVAPLVVWWLRPFIALDALAFYLGKTIFPHSLGIDYGRAPGVVLKNATLMITAAIPLILGGLIGWVRILRPLLPAFIFWVLALSPSLGLMPFYFQNISTVADRYGYTAFAGFALALALVLSTWRPSYARVFGLALILVIGGVSVNIVSRWQNSETLFSNTLKTNSQSWLAHVNYGSYLVDRNRPKEGIALISRALTLRNEPNLNVAAHFNLANAYFDMKDYTHALKHYDEALVIAPSFARVRANRALTHLALQDYNRAAEDQDWALKTIKADPILLVQCAIVQSALGDYSKAWRFLLEAENLGHEVPAKLKSNIRSKINDLSPK
jgi:protein O-mannosyl-transferase